MLSGLLSFNPFAFPITYSQSCRCDLRAAETDACAKSAEVDELLGQRERLEAVCAKQRDRMRQLAGELAASYDRTGSNGAFARGGVEGGDANNVECERCAMQQSRTAEISALLDKLTYENAELRRMLDSLAREMADNILPRITTSNGCVHQHYQQPEVVTPAAIVPPPPAPPAPAPKSST